MPWDADYGDLLGAGRRARALHALHKGRPVIVVTSAAALLRCVPPAGAHVFEPLTLTAGGRLDLDEATATLVRMGYERTDLAEARGQFAVRGGLLDVFGSDAPYPVRVELFGDEIETIRRYVPTTGQSIGSVEAVEVYAAREGRAGHAGRRQRATGLRPRRALRHGHRPGARAHRAGRGFNGVEAWLPALYNAVGTVTDYFGPSTLVEVVEPRSLFDDAAREHERVSALPPPPGATWRACSSRPPNSTWERASG